jgi:hypothetical protein
MSACSISSGRMTLTMCSIPRLGTSHPRPSNMAEQEIAPRTPKDSERSERSEKVLQASCQSFRSTYELIREAAARDPKQMAITLLTGGESPDRPGLLSYGALLGGIHQTANLLADLGVEPGILNFPMHILPEQCHFSPGLALCLVFHAQSAQAFP